MAGFRLYSYWGWESSAVSSPELAVYQPLPWIWLNKEWLFWGDSPHINPDVKRGVVEERSWKKSARWLQARGYPWLPCTNWDKHRSSQTLPRCISWRPPVWPTPIDTPRLLVVSTVQSSTIVVECSTIIITGGVFKEKVFQSSNQQRWLLLMAISIVCPICDSMQSCASPTAIYQTYRLYTTFTASMVHVKCEWNISA